VVSKTQQVDPVTEHADEDFENKGQQQNTGQQANGVKIDIEAVEVWLLKITKIGQGCSLHKVQQPEH